MPRDSDLRLRSDVRARCEFMKAHHCDERYPCGERSGRTRSQPARDERPEITQHARGCGAELLYGTFALPKYLLNRMGNHDCGRSWTQGIGVRLKRAACLWLFVACRRFRRSLRRLRPWGLSGGSHRGVGGGAMNRQAVVYLVEGSCCGDEQRQAVLGLGMRGGGVGWGALAIPWSRGGMWGRQQGLCLGAEARGVELGGGGGGPMVRCSVYRRDTGISSRHGGWQIRGPVPVRHAGVGARPAFSSRCG